MARGRKTALTLHLTADERQTLMAWQRSTTIPAGRARRGRIILLLADGLSLVQIADMVGTTRRAIYKWAQRFLQHGIEGLADAPGRGRRQQNALHNGMEGQDKDPKVVDIILLRCREHRWLYRPRRRHAVLARAF